MLDTMYIGSGDVSALMSGLHTKTHVSLLQRFVSGVKPYYNALASPIDACRIGAILEDRYLKILPDNYFAQYVVNSTDMNVFKASIDFAKIEGGSIVDFDELKTLYLSDFLEFIEPIKSDQKSLLNFLKKKHKKYYNQVQQQMYCTGLDSCNLVFLSVYSYEDDENNRREIKSNEYCKIRVFRDEIAIEAIKERAKIFQQIKDYYNE